MSLYIFLYKGQVYDTVTVDKVLSDVHSSVKAEPLGPPAAIAETAPPDLLGIIVALPDDISFISVHDEPFQNSVLPVALGVPPPKTIPELVRVRKKQFLVRKVHN